MTRLDRWERRLQVLMRSAPYALLAISVGLFWLTESPGPGDQAAVVGLSAAWLWFAEDSPSVRIPDLVWKTGYVAVLLGFVTVLGSYAVWFTVFFGFSGYLCSWRLLQGPWRFVGVAATAVLSVAGYTGVPGNAAELVTAGLFTAAITVLVVLFSFVGDVTAERSAERNRTVERLEAALAENAGLHAQLLVQAREAGVLDERQRVAAEIHDTLAQSLTGIIAQLNAAGADPGWRSRVDKALRLARDGLAEARRTVHAVGPVQLEEASLPQALTDVGDEWSGLNGTPTTVTVTGTVRPLHSTVEGTVLRIAQECLANAAKHADADRVDITLSYMEDVVVLDVVDGGRGFDAQHAADTGGFGLASMRRRVERIGGVFAVESAPGDGTAISATVPALERREDA